MSPPHPRLRLHAVSFGFWCLGAVAVACVAQTFSIEPTIENVDFRSRIAWRWWASICAPWAIQFLPDGRVLFTAKIGRVRVIGAGRQEAQGVSRKEAKAPER